MSLIKAIKAQLGLSNTPANNFTITAEADNGTLKMARGNAGATTQDILTVDANGRVAMPSSIVAFDAYASASTSLVANTYTKVLFQTENYDTANAYDAALSRFKPPVAGYYIINAGLQLSTTQSTIVMHLYKNGVAWRSIQYVVGNQSGCYGSSIVYLNGSTDYLEVYVYQNYNQGNNPDPVSTYFSGSLIAKA